MRSQDCIDALPAAGLSSGTKERRRHPRRSIRLAASIGSSEAAARRGEIHDFCDGGLFLACGDPAVLGRGQIVEIRCTVPRPGGDVALAMHGRIVRTGPRGVGIAFLRADEPGVALLRAYAEPRAAKEPGQRLRIGQLIAPTAAAGVRLVDAFLGRVRERVLQAVDTVEAIGDRNAFYDAANAFAKCATRLKHDFDRALRHDLEATPTAERRARREGLSQGSGLCLVDAHEFEDWLTFSETVRQAEMTFEEPLALLAARLSITLGGEFDERTNPLGPATFCHAFQEALAPLDLPRVVIPVVSAVFEDVLCGRDASGSPLGELYEELNRTLAERGVLPNVTDSFGIVCAGLRKAAQAPGRGSPAASAPTERRTHAPASACAPPPAAAPASAPTDLDAVPAAQWATLLANLAAAKAAHAAAAPLPPTARSSFSPTDAPASVSFGSPAPPSVGHARTFAGPGAPSAVPAAAPKPVIPPVDSSLLGSTPDAELAASAGDASLERANYSPEEIVAALAPLAGDDAGPPEPFTAKVQAFLAQPGREVPIHEARVLDRTAGLFDALLAASDIAGPARDSLRLLFVPLLRLALRDEAVLRDRSHAARALIDTIARLELHDDGSGNAVRRTVAAALQDVARAEDVEAALGEAVKRTRTLLRVQSKAYDENVREAVQRCTRGAATGPRLLPASPAGAAPADPEVERWKRRVRRLAAGRSLVVGRGASARRVRIACVDQSGEQYVLVNARGFEDSVASADDLAHCLRDGTVTLVPESAGSPFEHAHYDVLSNEHRAHLRDATRDPLTGMGNRREFERRVAEALVAARAGERPHAVVYVDLDQFSVINETFGYAGGDRLLAEVAALLQQHAGEAALVARLSGDEFGMLLPDCTAHGAADRVAAQRAAVDAYRLVVGEKSAPISFTAGIAAITPDLLDGSAVLQRAEASCRLARGKGRNVHVWDSGDADAQHGPRLSRWATRIDDALRHERLSLRVQPIVRVTGGERHLHHAEVLLSVPDESGAPGPPADFIQAAEQLRRMPAVDRWVIDHAFRWMAAHPEKLARVGGLAINLSGTSMSDESLVPFILDTARYLAVPMERVSFEITETAGIANLNDAVELMRALKAHGASFALDDFGSGLSSYGYLRNLPVDFLKIDGAFVKDMQRGGSDYAVVKSITEIGHFMGMSIIAEYVESDAIFDMLRDIGVDFAQGYGVGKPRPLTEL